MSTGCGVVDERAHGARRRALGARRTLGDVVAKLGEVTEFETPIGTWKVRIKDGRLTSDPRRAEFLVEPA